jgi:hypothetical protein
MYVFCVYPAMSKKSENLSDLNKKDRNKRHSSPFINVVKAVFFVVRVTVVPFTYLSASSAVHSYRVPGKFIRWLKSLFVMDVTSVFMSEGIRLIRNIIVTLFIKQSVHLLYKYDIQINFCFIRTRRINFSYYTNKLFSQRINFPGTL